MVEAKGRNGYFRVHNIEIWRVEHDGKPQIQIEIRAERSRWNAPARIEGPEEEMRNLIGILYNAVVKKAKAIPGRVTITGIGTEQITLEE